VESDRRALGYRGLAAGRRSDRPVSKRYARTQVPGPAFRNPRGAGVQPLIELDSLIGRVHLYLFPAEGRAGTHLRLRQTPGDVLGVAGDSVDSQSVGQGRQADDGEDQADGSRDQHLYGTESSACTDTPCKCERQRNSFPLLETMPKRLAPAYFSGTQQRTRDSSANFNSNITEIASSIRNNRTLRLDGSTVQSKNQRRMGTLSLQRLFLL